MKANLFSGNPVFALIVLPARTEERHPTGVEIAALLRDAITATASATVCRIISV